MMLSKGGFSRFLSSMELEQLYNHRNKARGRLPSWKTAFCRDEDVNFKRTTKEYMGEQAARMIQATPKGAVWLKAHKHRFLPASKHSEVASAMAELRCYGALLEAGYEVNPLPTSNVPTPDFEVSLFGDTFFVEVATKQEDGAETILSNKIANGETPEGVSRHVKEDNELRIETIIRCQYPLGKPDPSKENDSVQANSISRICAIKGKETQAQDAPTLIWIDLRDLSEMHCVVSKDQFDPIISGLRDGQLTSGCVWYSFYGWKGAPIFEETGGHREKKVIMGHEGRFSHVEPPSKYSGAVVCTDGASALFENPNALYALSDDVRLMLHGLPEFDIGSSVASWTKGGAKKDIALNKSMIEAFNAAQVRLAAGLY